MKYDLHMHSDCSDGKYTRLELLKKMNELEFKYASFCDHNYISDDIDEINEKYKREYSEKQKVKMILGTEFDIQEYSRLHILGYDMKNIEIMQQILNKFEKENTEICLELLKKIRSYYGIDIPFEELTKYTKNGNVTKNVVVQWLIDNNYADSVYDAGMRFTSKYSPCYVERSRLKLKDVIELIKESDGLAVMAHPSSMEMDDIELDLFIKKLCNFGLDGIEVYNADKTNENQRLFYQSIADKYNLFATSGSDFHNEAETPVFGVDNEYSNKFLKVLKRR